MGNMTTADISLLEKVTVGDYIMVHAGFAIQKYDEDEAKATLELLKELFEKTKAGGNEF
jgi:hydrogenase expression/formation protein HypC